MTLGVLKVQGVGRIVNMIVYQMVSERLVDFEVFIREVLGQL
jgi:hypothetical protein